eukprot:CAMPEP_0172173856 /NCGR_PEP_ID=MMETSP1050-20130122/13321_1 /TAXON_ID=233186 /ORGANISM="Cryptomonas curvata, Strain CCAP979/52" /LENGTH=65 /DNA_ID=CAMNT_0012845727 /DNA_START=267 /DNA_END=464 /DNA_ORIENTATION=+
MTLASIFISSSASLASAAMLSGTGGFSSNCLSVACFMRASATMNSFPVASIWNVSTGANIEVLRA